MRTLWRWQAGRQHSGYRKMLLFGLRWPMPCDLYLLHFPPGASVPTHVDPVAQGRHYRLNIILKAAQRGGEFVCAEPIRDGRRVKLFRPDRQRHGVTPIEAGSRWVLSLGWVSGARGRVRPAA